MCSTAEVLPLRVAQTAWPIEVVFSLLCELRGLQLPVATSVTACAPLCRAAGVIMCNVHVQALAVVSLATRVGCGRLLVETACTRSVSPTLPASKRSTADLCWCLRSWRCVTRLARDRAGGGCLPPCWSSLALCGAGWVAAGCPYLGQALRCLWSRMGCRRPPASGTNSACSGSMPGVQLAALCWDSFSGGCGAAPVARGCLLPSESVGVWWAAAGCAPPLLAPTPSWSEELLGRAADCRPLRQPLCYELRGCGSAGCLCLPGKSSSVDLPGTAPVWSCSDAWQPTGQYGGPACACVFADSGRQRGWLCRQPDLTGWEA